MSEAKEEARKQENSQEPEFVEEKFEFSDDVQERMSRFVNKLGAVESGVLKIPKGESRFVLTVNDQIAYVRENGKVFAIGECELIARITTVGSRALWRWGYTFDKELQMKFVPKRDENPHPAMRGAIIGAPIMALDVFIMLVFEKEEFEFVEEVRLGPEESQKYWFGVRKLRRVVKDSDIPSWVLRDERLVDILNTVKKRVKNPNKMPPGMTVVPA